MRAQPGITIPELAEKMGIKQNYLYRVMPDLASQGQVTKSGRGWHARGGLTTPARASHGVALLTELGDRAVDALLGEVGDVEPLHDLATRRPTYGTGTRR